MFKNDSGSNIKFGWRTAVGGTIGCEIYAKVDGTNYPGGLADKIWVDNKIKGISDGMINWDPDWMHGANGFTDIRAYLVLTGSSPHLSLWITNPSDNSIYYTSDIALTLNRNGAHI